MPSIFSALAGFRRALAAALAAVLLGWLSVAAHAQGCPTTNFITSKKFTVGSSPFPNAFSIATGDFNNDGKADIAVANNGDNNVSILLGDGTGGFGAASNFAVGSRPQSVAVADFNGDSKADLTVVNRDSNNVSVLLGNGAGGFGAPANFSAGQDPRSVAVGDFNRDGRPDMAVGISSNGDQNASILLGDGAGGFSSPTNFGTGGGEANFVATADLNTDGKLDLIVAHASSSKISILLGDGAGGFGSPAPFSAVVVDPASIAVGDFNGDLKPDLAVANDNAPGANLGIAFGDGTGHFGNGRFLNTGQRAHDVKTGDFNGDGRDDVVITSFTDNTVAVLLSDGAGNFTPPTFFSTGTFPWSIAVSDFNADGRPDLAVANSQSANVSVLLGTGGGLFASTRFVPAGFSPGSMATGDFNLDSNPDLLVLNGSATSLTLLLGDGTGNVSAPIAVLIPFGSADVVVSDFNLDGKPDIALAHSFANSVSVMTGTGTGQFTQAGTFPVGASPQSVEVADLNSDGLPDLVVANRNTDVLSILLGSGGGAFSPATSLFVGSSPSAVSAGDLNGDGRTDLVVTMVEGTNAVLVLLATGPATFDTPATFAVGSGPSGAVVADFDGDGRADLVVANGGSHNISVLRGDGLGSFSPATNHAAAFSPSSPVVADFNGDARLDIAAVNSNNVNANSVSILHGDGAGNFAPAVFYDAGLFPGFIVATDLNKDGRPDIAASKSGAGTVGLLLNTCAEPFAALPQLSVGNLMVTEGDSSSSQAIFNVSLSAPSSRTVTVGIYTADETAARDSDYQPSLASLTFAPGVTSQTFAVPVNGDVLDEFDETFAVVLRHPLGATLAAARSSGAINDDDPEPTISIADATTTEGDDGSTLVNLALTLSAASGKPVSAQVTSSDGTAVAGLDYTALNTTVTFNSGTTTQTVSLSLNGDVLDEHDETLSINLSNVVNATVADGQGVVTILDNDPPPAVSISDVTANEGPSGTTNFVFLVTLSAPSGKVVSVSFATADGTAMTGDDYAALSGTVVFNPSETVKQVIVAVNGDLTTEPDETFFVNLSGPVNANVTDAQGLGTVLNNVPPTLAFSAASFSVAEAAGHFTVSVTRTGDTALPVSVEYATGDATASERSDYTTALGTLRFAAGETARSFRVIVTNDVRVEGPETFTVTLRNPTNAALGATTSATVEISDDDTDPNAPNPIDSASFFVRQHYADFLNREPDEAGLNFWAAQITECGTDAGCVDSRRQNVSAAFFLSIEFQQTGYLVYRAYASAFGKTRVGGRVPLTLQEFLPDTQQIGSGVVVNAPGWEELLEQNKRAYLESFVTRPQFTSVYQPGMEAHEFVDKLNANAGNVLSPAERDALVIALGTQAKTRAEVLRAVAEDADLVAAERNPAFVLMQYFGYLRRNPNDAPELNLDFGGYNFWLAKLNGFGGNFVAAEMVRSFLVSGEYRGRFK